LSIQGHQSCHIILAAR